MKMDVNLKELNGTEKQVKWANDIRQSVLETIEEAHVIVQNSDTEKKDAYAVGYTDLKYAIENIDSAKVFIDSFRHVLNQESVFNKAFEIKDSLNDIKPYFEKGNLKASRFLGFTINQRFTS
jgi:hypothetical protein